MATLKASYQEGPKCETKDHCAMFYLVFFSSTIREGKQMFPNLLKTLFISSSGAKFTVTCKTLYLIIIAIYLPNAIF